MYEEYYYEDLNTGDKYPLSIYHNRPTAEMKVIGKVDTRRVGIEPRVTGQAKYANDIVLPNMLYLKYKRSPYSHAKVISIDTARAKALPGVVRVLTHADVPDLIVRPPYHYAINEEAWLQGQEVAAVAAEEEDIAEEAVNLIDVEYEVLPFVIYAEDSQQPGAPILWGETNLVGSPWKHERGDVDAGLAQADKVVGPATYATMTKPWSGLVPHTPIDTETMTASWENGRMTIWSSQQNTHSECRSIAAQLGLPVNKVVQPPHHMGLGWGGKGSNGNGRALAAWIARETNRPVKWRQDAEGYFNTGRSSWNMQKHTLEAGVKNDGTLTAIKDRGFCNSGAFGGRAGSGADIIRKMYVVPNLSIEVADYATNTQGIGSPRCVAHPSCTATADVFMDSVPEAINMDPTDFMLKNVFKESGIGGDQDYPERDIGTTPMPGMLEELIEASGWKNKWKGWGTPVAVNGSKRRGIGFAPHCCTHGSLSHPLCAHIKANNDGTWDVSAGSTDHGQGFRTTAQVMAAEELGVPIEDVYAADYSTDNVQESVSASGSRATRGTGTAVILAVRDAKEQLFKIAIAAGLIEADKPEDLETGDGDVYLKADPTVRVTIKKVCSKQSNTLGPIIGRGSYAHKRTGTMDFQWALAIAEVEVDTDTGEVQVLNVWESSDTGRTIFHKGALNQLQSGVIGATGRALFEGLVKDESTGITLNANYLEYKLATHMDVPNIHPYLYESINHYGPFGCRGIGEPVYAPAQAAIPNAIYNAIGGTRINSTMITPDKVLAAIGKA